MKFTRKPIVLVRWVGQHYEYYIQQGNKKINFFLHPETHDELKAAQHLAEQPERRLVETQRQGPHRKPIQLTIETGDQISAAARNSGSAPAESK